MSPVAEVNDLVRLFKAVANKRRVEILRLLLDEGEKNHRPQDHESHAALACAFHTGDCAAA